MNIIPIDIERFLKQHWTHPKLLLKRSMNHIIFMLKGMILKYFVLLGKWLRKNLHVQPLTFDTDGVFFKIPRDLEFRYLPELYGGLGELPFGKSWERAELKLLLRRLPREGVFLDIGASFGWFALNLATLKAAKVYAFEPAKLAFENLSANVKRNNLVNTVNVFNIALGNKNRKAFLINNGYFGSFIQFDKKEKGGTETVKMITLDSFTKHEKPNKIDLIKCDTEGVELFILKGGRKTLKHYHPELLLEIEPELTKRFGYNPEEIFSFLEELGYKYLRMIESGALKLPSKNKKKEFVEGHNFFFYHGDSKFF